MRSQLLFSALPASLLALVSQATANHQAPIAVKKLSLDEGEKLFPEHLAFAPFELPEVASLDDYTDPSLPHSYRRAFAPHHDGLENNVLRRAAKALALLQRRSSCPSEMNSCADIGHPNKCCQEGTYCSEVEDESVGQVACCPEGRECGGNVGSCPENAVSCPASLGGGCCIAGFVCQGSGCIRSELATPSETATETAVETTTSQGRPETVTTTRTTVIEGRPSTVVVTLTVTEEPSIEPTTVTSTEVITASPTETATGGAPWRPTTDPESSETTRAPSSESESTQEGCPTGFYGCLATHGGGCCRTDRDCETHSCPAQPRTTIVSEGATVVVPVEDVPASATETCADGWFLCGADAGPVAGCCPSGFDCGTASCFTVEASQTAQIQKVFPEDSASEKAAQLWDLKVLGALTAVMMLLMM